MLRPSNVDFEKHLSKMSDENQIPIDPEEEYKSSEDEDFNPDGLEAAQDEDLSSSEDEEVPQPKTKKAPKKRKKAQADAEEELDSGDEATITELRKSKKRKTDDDEDSGGEGGLIKTRAQRKAECVQLSHHLDTMLICITESKSVRSTNAPMSRMSLSTSMPYGPP